MTAIYALRSLLHLLFMAVTVVPWALVVVLAAPWVSGARTYRLCVAWLATSVWAGGWILGIKNRVTGWEHLPKGSRTPRCCWSNTSRSGRPSACRR